jgi:hypothetical protein
MAGKVVIALTQLFQTQFKQTIGSQIKREIIPNNIRERAITANRG